MEEQRIKASGFVVQPRLKFQNIIDKFLYQHLIEDANYQDKEKCKRGQTIISINKLSEETGWNRGVIRGSINRLAKSSYISIITLKQKKGTLVTITDYDYLQNTSNYSKKINQQDDQQDNQQTKHENNQQRGIQKSCESKVEPSSDNSDNQQNEQQDNQQNDQRINLTLTEYINSIININKTLKEYIADAPVKNKNLSTTEEIETFVDFALRTNALPTGVSKKILISYFDCIRLTRQTCTISANILANLIDKMDKYSVDQLHYAMWKHCEQHEDKREQYTLGILRHTDMHDAKRGLMKLKNKGVAHYAKSSQYPAAVGESTSSTSKEVERLEAIARERGLYGQIRDVELDF